MATRHRRAVLRVLGCHGKRRDKVLAVRRRRVACCARRRRRWALLSLARGSQSSVTSHMLPHV